MSINGEVIGHDHSNNDGGDSNERHNSRFLQSTHYAFSWLLLTCWCGNGAMWESPITQLSPMPQRDCSAFMFDRVEFAVIFSLFIVKINYWWRNGETLNTCRKAPRTSSGKCHLLSPRSQASVHWLVWVWLQSVAMNLNPGAIVTGGPTLWLEPWNWNQATLLCVSKSSRSRASVANVSTCHWGLLWWLTFCCVGVAMLPSCCSSMLLFIIFFFPC